VREFDPFKFKPIGQLKKRYEEPLEKIQSGVKVEKKQRILLEF
jgi:hypothetical protein